MRNEDEQWIYFDHQRDQALAEIVTNHCFIEFILFDTVSIHHEFQTEDFPSEPPLCEGSIEREHVRESTCLTAAETPILVDVFSNCFDLSLLTVSS